MSYENLRLQAGEDYIGSKEIASHVEELGEYYRKRYEEVDEVLVIALMQGAVFFAADLVRAMRHPNAIWDTLRAGSYDGTRSTGIVNVKYDNDTNPRGRHLLLVEDIIDGGTTLAKITRRFADHDPASLAVVSLLEKPENRLPDTELATDDVRVGIQIADSFVVGYGLDWKDPEGISRHRTLPHISVVEEPRPGFFVPKVPVEP